MKNKFREWMSRMESVAGVRLLKNAWRMLSHNFGLKVLSLLIAILMWNFVVTSNSSITRTKPITGLTCYINNQSALNPYGLALMDNLNEELKRAFPNLSFDIEFAADV